MCQKWLESIFFVIKIVGMELDGDLLGNIATLLLDGGFGGFFG